MNVRTFCISIHDKDYYQKVYDLRENILRKPIGLSLQNENLSDDQHDTIVITQIEETVAACVMIHPLTNTVAKLRQMAVHSDWQGKGIGIGIIKFAENLIWNKHYEKIILHARITAREFYQKSGYSPVGAIFTEVGIPHIAMEKTAPYDL